MARPKKTAFDNRNYGAEEDPAPKPSAIVNVAMKPRAAKLSPIDFQEADIKRRLWVANPLAGVDYAALLDPEGVFWAHNASRMSVGDRIEVNPQDNRYFAELIVRATGPAMAVVQELRYHALHPVKPNLDNRNYEIEHRGGRQWCIVRKTDKQIVQEMIPTQELAFQSLTLNHSQPA